MNVGSVNPNLFIDPELTFSDIDDRPQFSANVGAS